MCNMVAAGAPQMEKEPLCSVHDADAKEVCTPAEALLSVT